MFAVPFHKGGTLTTSGSCCGEGIRGGVKGEGIHGGIKGEGIHGGVKGKLKNLLW